MAQIKNPAEVIQFKRNLESIDYKKLHNTLRHTMVKHFTAPELEYMLEMYSQPLGRAVMAKMGNYAAEITPRLHEAMQPIIQSNADFMVRACVPLAGWIRFPAVAANGVRIISPIRPFILSHPKPTPPTFSPPGEEHSGHGGGQWRRAPGRAGQARPPPPPNQQGRPPAPPRQGAHVRSINCWLVGQVVCSGPPVDPSTASARAAPLTRRFDRCTHTHTHTHTHTLTHTHTHKHRCPTACTRGAPCRMCWTRPRPRRRPSRPRPRPSKKRGGLYTYILHNVIRGDNSNTRRRGVSVV